MGRSLKQLFIISGPTQYVQEKVNEKLKSFYADHHFSGEIDAEITGRGDSAEITILLKVYITEYAEDLQSEIVERLNQIADALSGREHTVSECLHEIVMLMAERK